MGRSEGKDETFEELGTKLHLPPWYEAQREAIVALLEPITVPEENRPKPGTTNVPRAVPGTDASRAPLSRNAPRFGGA